MIKISGHISFAKKMKTTSEKKNCCISLYKITLKSPMLIIEFASSGHAHIINKKDNKEKKRGGGGKNLPL